MTEHLLEMAKARVRVKDGKIEVLTDPLINCCPLRRDLYGIKEESRETVQRVLHCHMQEMGMYGPNRVMELLEKPVGFGASEILADAMTEGLVDAAVVVCEGAGTVVVARPDVLQAVGAHMTGLIETEPIREIQDDLVKRGSLLLCHPCGPLQAAPGWRVAESPLPGGALVAAARGPGLGSVARPGGPDCKHLQDMRDNGHFFRLFCSNCNFDWRGSKIPIESYDLITVAPIARKNKIEKNAPSNLSIKNTFFTKE
jgi:hypothetical protein